ncbi:hypothetical protein ALC56_09944, partial [Trachymyrmex septentrionalis]
PSLFSAVKDYDIFGIQETLLKQHNPFKVKGLKIIRKDIVQTGDRGVCILIRNNINYEVLEFKNTIHPSVEFLVIKIFYSNTESVVVVNIYIHQKLLSFSIIL